MHACPVSLATEKTSFMIIASHVLPSCLTAARMASFHDLPLMCTCAAAAIIFCGHPDRQQWLPADQLALDPAQLWSLSDRLLGSSLHD